MSEWEPPGPHGADGDGRGLVIVLLAIGPLLLGALALATGAAALWVAAVVLAAVEGAWVLSQSRLLLAGAASANAADHTRFVNIAHGLSKDLGLPVPRLFVSAVPGANALVLPGAIVVSGDLLTSYTRTELEAVVAHCLVRLRAGGLGWALAGAAVGRVAGPRVDRAVDARAASVTRYPPGLAEAIRKASVASGRTRALWFVAGGPSHAPVEERVAELQDL